MPVQKTKEENIEKALKMLVLPSVKAQNYMLSGIVQPALVPEDRNEKVFEMAETLMAILSHYLKIKSKGPMPLLYYPYSKRQMINILIPLYPSRENIIGFCRKIHVTDIPLWEEKILLLPGRYRFSLFLIHFMEKSAFKYPGTISFRRDQDTENEWR